MADITPRESEEIIPDEFGFEFDSHSQTDTIPTTLSPSDRSHSYKLTHTATQQPRIYVLTGPNQCNKRSVAMKLRTDFPAYFERVVSHTTRQPHPLEINGVDYNFIPREEFLEMIREDKFLQYIHVGKGIIIKIKYLIYIIPFLLDKTDVILIPTLNQIPTQGDLFGITNTTFHQASHSNAAALLMTLHPSAVESLSFKTKCIYLSTPAGETLLEDTEIPIISTMDIELAYSEVKNVIFEDLKVNPSGINTLESEPLLTAQIEWDNVENMQAIRESGKLDVSSVSQNPVRILNSTHALEYFRNRRMLDYINRIVLPPEPTGIRKLFRLIFGPPSLHNSLINERNLVLAMALHAFDNTDSFHTTILESIYRLLTQSKFRCQRYGIHWEEIGFQGNDPATDLRGAGMLGLVNLFDFVTSPIAYQIALDVLKLSRDVTQAFPMCALSMSLTVMVITFLRDGRLSKICNSRGMVFSVVNDVYKALFYRLYNIWRDGHKTIWDSSTVLQELELNAKGNILCLLKEFYNALKIRKAGDTKIVSKAREVEFQGIDEIDLELSFSTE